MKNLFACTLLASLGFAASCGQSNAASEIENIGSDTLLEVAGALAHLPEAPVLVPFIGGLGGRDIPVDELEAIVGVARTAADTGRAPEPRLLFTAKELDEMRKLQGIAAARAEKGAS